MTMRNISKKQLTLKPVESITKSLAKELDKLNNIREDSLGYLEKLFDLVQKHKKCSQE